MQILVWSLRIAIGVKVEIRVGIVVSSASGTPGDATR
jgi:hypothetical protein